MTQPTPQDPASTPAADTSKDLQGEGNYDAARKFDAEERAFVESGKVDAAARAARKALDGPEGEDLEAARHAAARGETLKKP
jgi:hypothetical protein